MKLLFDIETNGLPRQGLDHIHCVVVKDIDTEEVFRFNDTGNSDSIPNAITLLQEADVLIGHNIVGFDIPVIQGIYPFFNPKATLFDTLILSRMFFPVEKFLCLSRWCATFSAKPQVGVIQTHEVFTVPTSNADLIIRRHSHHQSQ